MIKPSIIFAIIAAYPCAFAGSLQIDVALSPAGSFKAETQKVNGTAYRTADGIAAKDVTVDLKSLSTGIALRDKHTKERLQVEKFPQAKLIKASGKDGKGTATIEVSGKIKEVAGTYKIDGHTLKAEFPMKLSDLAITGVRYMAVGVKDDVKVHIDLPLSEGKPGTAASGSK